MNTAPALTDRQQDVLQAIINTHITTADTVGSRTVAKNMGNRLSPASIRNVMSDLEEMGYVKQPHTSAGRIPTDLGYRVYVNNLMKTHVVKLEQRRWIEDHYEYGIKQIEDLLETTASLLSILTHYTAVVQLPKRDLETIKFVELVPLSGARVVVIIVTDTGNVRKHLALLPRDTTDAEREKLAHFMNDRFNGLSFAKARSALETLDSGSDALNEKLARLATELLADALDDDRPREIFLEGIENIFEEPEFKNIERLRPVLRVLDEKRRVNLLLEYCVPEDELNDIRISIGSENPFDDIRNCSVVASPYHIGDKMWGAIGVIGPTRMRYSLASSFVAFVADQLGLFLTKISGGS